MRAQRVLALSLLGACWLLSLGRAAAQAVVVPDSLEPWRNWVLYGEEFRACPVLNGSAAEQAGGHVCAWPGRLSVEVGATSAIFDQSWTLYAEGWIPLPGDAEHWPARVTVDGNSAAVIARETRPSVWLGRGAHRLAGEIAYATRPASLAVPRQTGIVALRLDGRDVASPELDAGTLWFGLRPDAEVEEDRLDVVVYRRLDDALPMDLDTQIKLDVAGQSREVTLEGVALEGFVGEKLDAQIPAQLMPDGKLRIQVRPGTWTVTVRSRAATPAAQIARAALVEPWPADEIWSFAPEPRLRVASLEGVAAIDAARSGVPDGWQDLASYRVAAGDSVRIVERSRTDAAEANRLSLRRDLWLDFDGRGFTARDLVTGRMSSGWRLDMAPPYTMTMAAIDDENLLVTVGTEPGVQGVELRSQSLKLTSTARVTRTGGLPVTGYRDSFDDVTTTVHVPPGYRVLAAPGAESAEGAWIELWSLLDIFVVLIITAAAWRLLGPVPGAIALLALVIAFHEPDAPRWAWLNLLVAVALLRVAPEGRFKTWCMRYKWASLAALVVLLIPFTVGQLRMALHPQLERFGLERGIASEQPGVASFAAAPASIAVLERARRAEPSGAVDEITVTGSRKIGGDLARYQPGALVQVGPGLPDWDWNRYTLRFSGPVDAGQSFRLLLLGPWGVASWRIASVALALALLFAVSGGSLRVPPNLLRGTAAAAALALVAFARPNVADAQARNDFPSPALLDELKARLTKSAPCHPACAEINSASVTVSGDSLNVELDLALQAPVAVPVPSAQRASWPTAISVDGTATAWLFRDASQTAWLPLTAGVHRVALRGPLAAANAVSVPFPLRPRRIAVTASGWDVSGMGDGRLRSGTLELTRQRAAGAAGEIGGTVFPPFVTVARRVELDVDWRVTTTVTRVAPVTGAFTLPVDLLANEAVLTPGIDVAGGRATVAFAADQAAVAWRSRLPTAATLTLAAPASAAWSESWTFAVSQIWHAEYGGLPSTVPAFLDPSAYTPAYFPRPGETLTVTVRRPDPASGDTIAIDTAHYTREVGARSTVGTLELTYRSTRGREHVVALPQGSVLESVEIDHDAVPLELDGRSLSIPVTPGEHEVEIVWRDAAGVSPWTNVPVVDLGGGASNVETTLSLPGDRWVLLSLGPRLGPAILYWPELLALVIAAVVLGRLALSPLRTHEWLLLGIGLSTFAWPVLALFAVWAFAMSWRGRAQISLPRLKFNALQIALGALTVIAIAAVVGAIPFGLLGRPDMQVVSPVSYGTLSWFVDRTTGLTPESGVLSVSLWFYRAAMLAWALWLSFALLRWLGWAWRAFGHGALWQRKAPA